MDNTISYERYQRQMILKNFGEAGQNKLSKAKVLIVGAGGLGCPALQYLAGAGVGTIGIVDDDAVSLSNLHRQVLYSVRDLGCNKAEKAAEILTNLNPEIRIQSFPERLTVHNACSIIEAFDIIVDGTDNFSSRYLINDVCVLVNKPLVYGAVSQYEGQVAILNYRESAKIDPVNYRDLFPQPPRKNEISNCAEAGVLGILPGIIGTMQANETIKLITGIGRPLVNRLLTYNALTNQLYEMELSPRKETHSLLPATRDELSKMDYDWICSARPNDLEIDHDLFDELIDSGRVDVIDVREPGEFPEIKEFSCHQIPLSQLQENISKIKSDTVVTICQSGRRSLHAARQLAEIFGSSKKIFSLRGGIVQWKQRNTKEFYG